MKKHIDVTAIIAQRLSKLPKKINLFHSSDVLTEGILWEFSHEMCFHLSSIAYFVYNPDFHICKGIAGLLKKDLGDWCSEPWNDMESFEEKTLQSPFNVLVKKTLFSTHPGQKLADIIEKIKEQIDLPHELSYTWNIKHDNIGILLYFPSEQTNTYSNEDIHDAVEFLTFCKL